MKQFRPAPGTSPAALVQHAGREQRPPVFRVTEYGRDYFRQHDVKTVADLPDLPPEDRFLWVEMDGLGDLEQIRALGKKYGLHPLTLEDAVNTGQRPKYETYQQHAFLLAQMIYHDHEENCTHEQVCIFFQPRLCVCIQEEPERDVFDPVRQRLQEGRGAIRHAGSDYLAYALLDCIIDHLYPVLEQLGNEIEELEDLLLDKPVSVLPRRIHRLKRTLTRLRRAVWPERDVVSAMLHDESGLISKETKIFLRDCYDHTVQAMDFVESYRDEAAALMDLYLSSVSLRTNEVMRVLTVISSIFIPLTFVAGLYGMNFDWAEGRMPFNMPELHWPHGYLGCLLIMSIIAVGQVLFFRRKGWL